MSTQRPAFPLVGVLLGLATTVAGAGSSTEDGVAGDWLSSVQRRIAEQEYHVTWQERTSLPDLDAAWHAPNRAHGFRTYFTERGIRVVPRTDRVPSWEWALSLVGYGRGAPAPGVERATLSADGDRIEYHRGAVTEWYVNTPKGLKQGFTLEAPPEGPEGAEVRLDLVLGGTLSPKISADGQAIDFLAAGGAALLHYAELVILDAAGREIPARMEGFNESGTRGIRILFDDRQAVYPVTVDPLATSPAWSAEGNQTSAFLGYSVGTAGDVNGDGHADVIVGAYGYDNGQTDEGRAYVYHGSAAGLATTAAWTAESDQANAFFGLSVGTAGDVNGDGYADVVVGARLYDNGQADEGRAYVYHGSALGLSAAANWTAEANQTGARFGNAVGTAGDVNGDGYSDVIVGAYFHDNGQADEGRAYVYHGSAAGLAANAAWTAESNQATSWFGYAVATAGDVNGDGYADVIVGAYGYDNGEVNEGRAFVYIGSATGLPVNAIWAAESNQAAAFFGWAVGTAGDVNGDGYADVVVGARQYGNVEANEGRAYVYHGSATGPGVNAAWTAEADQAAANFGNSVGTAGDVNGDGYADVAIGANRFDSGQTDEGLVFVYHGSAAGLNVSEDWSAEGDQVSARFGTAVATAGDVDGDGYADLIVGTYFYDNGQTDEGRASVYHGSAAGLSTVEAWTAESDQAQARFGSWAGTAGDVNGDGYADVIVGAWEYDNGQIDEGRAYVYHGSAAGLSTVEAWTAESDQADAQFGISVGTAGDVNGDGYADVIVGANRYANGQAAEGRAYVYHGSVTGLSAVEAWSAESDQAEAFFGFPVGTAGDVNGDGYADVIVGAHAYDVQQLGSDEGRAYVYHGSAAGLGTVAAWSAESDQFAAAFGIAVGTAGDVNGDGYTDVIVSADLYDNGQTNEGQAYVYHGSAGGLATSPAWTVESDQASAIFGRSVGTAGDVNGDGYADVIVGAHLYDNGQSNEGRAFVYHGSAAGLSTAAAWTVEGDQDGAFLGNYAATGTAGDVNGDGYADVIVGAYGFDNGQTDEGRAYVYHGSAAGLSTVEAWTAESDQADALFGISTATAGDVNGDGYADVIVGAELYDNGPADEGRAFVYYGNDGDGLDLLPRQRRADDTAPIAPLGVSDAPDGFRLALIGRTPFGRARVKLEWEVKPLGTSFDAAGTSVSAAWMDTGTLGVAIDELVTGLATSTDHHWRVRLLYDPAQVPFQQASRWLTVPRNGWQEADLRTAVAPAGRVPDGDTLPGVPLTVDKATGSEITLTWGDSCTGTDDDYAIYEGSLGSFASHTSKFCSTGGATSKTFGPAAGDRYYLVVPRNSEREGSYGLDGAGSERPVGEASCATQDLAEC